MEKKSNQSSSTVFKVGAIALAFLIVGYQCAVFVHRAAVERMASLEANPDTVFVVDSAIAARVLGGQIVPPECAGRVGFAAGSEGRSPGSGSRSENSSRHHSNGSGGRLPTNGSVIVRKSSLSATAQELSDKGRKVESFRFNPNTVSIDDLVRLGFSRNQAQSIDNYRAKGGKFRRREDFAKSFAVSDSAYERLEKYIDIPLLDINKADSAAFDALPGVGGWTAARMVSYRKELGGYSCKEQLMDIYKMDAERYGKIADLICCSASGTPFDLWHLPADSLRLHPYIKFWRVANAIVLFRENNPVSEWTVGNLAAAGILDPDASAKLLRCSIAPVCVPGCQ